MTDSKEPMGILLINKPKGWTSFDVCGKLRSMLHTKKIGHTGTLDPLATGVLPILVGKAARAADILPEGGKAYRAHFRLGLDTDTQDITGKVLATDDTPITKAQLEEALGSFVGEYMQTPPMYSAVKVGGKKLYEYAREGREIEREPKRRFVDFITLESYDEAAREGVMSLSVSKGTYIRTLICDAAAKLGTLGVMTALERTKANGFEIEGCISIEQAQALADEGKLTDRLLTLGSIFEGYAKVKLNEKHTTLYKNGVKLRPEQIGITGFDKDSRYRIYSNSGELISVAYVDVQKNEVRSLRNFY
ncbi:MAG: tRNA pseudouridine(55) synthase TruB [Ruminococcus sp.]|nr:tRNA pseudouridine(55) synthase TruB [Ruminococcus sp.]